MEELTLSGVLKKMEFMRDHGEEKGLLGYVETIEVRPYIGLLEKTQIIWSIFSLKSGFETYSPEIIAAIIEKARVMDLLLSYTNISVSDEEDTFDNYDRIVALGLDEYLENKCAIDYKRFYGMFLQFVSMENVLSVLTRLQTLDPQELRKERAEIQKLLTSVGPEFFEKMGLVLLNNDSGIAKNLQTYKEELVAEVKGSPKK